MGNWHTESHSIILKPQKLKYVVGSVLHTLTLMVLMAAQKMAQKHKKMILPFLILLSLNCFVDHEWLPIAKEEGRQTKEHPRSLC